MAEIVPAPAVSGDGAETVTQREDDTTAPSACTAFTPTKCRPSDMATWMSSGVTAVACGSSVPSTEMLVEAIAVWRGKSATTRTGEVTARFSGGEMILTSWEKSVAEETKNRKAIARGAFLDRNAVLQIFGL
jgi:hypothetical protein